MPPYYAHMVAIEAELATVWAALIGLLDASLATGRRRRQPDPGE